MSSDTCQTVGGSPPFQVFGLPWPDLNDGLFYADSVSSSDSELRLIEFYSRKYKNSAPLQGWLQRIQNGQITVDGGVVKDPNTVLRAASELVYHRLPWKEPEAPHLLQVLYEDSDIIALNKPSGLQVLPGGLFQQRTVLTQLQWRVSKQGSSLESQEPHVAPVHRLGRGTSGVLLCAKTKVAKSHLASCFADGTSLINNNSELSTRRKISKIYRALVDGILQEDEVTIRQPIGTVRYPGVAKGLYVASPSGKPALSIVRVLERDIQGNHTLVQVKIESGRPHQIRIHLSYIGHPLLGDPLYVAGGQPNLFDSEFADESFALDGGYQRPTKPVPGDCGYYLHAHQLILSHPITDKVTEIIAPLPLRLQTQMER
ncbi:RNA pseudouridine synthase 5 isoform X2 [Tripterygium wilfordii]|uniref:RNA pseudouridine synthase 5 isoform X2 n=1 Tax=Tripterygium wilfordii TaxID=458696 RepID=UPI0018F832FA|nr:RNA pseudouridine synthase 5 isoform X2 [Tripterygium wilfordii]